MAAAAAGGAPLAGTAGLRPLEDLGLEIIWSLAPEAQGRGYATEAARAVLDYALGPLGLPEVLAEIDEGNTASARVAERLGLTAFAVVPGLLGPMTRYPENPLAAQPDRLDRHRRHLTSGRMWPAARAAAGRGPHPVSRPAYPAAAGWPALTSG